MAVPAVLPYSLPVTQAIPPSAALPTSLPVTPAPTPDAPPAGNGQNFASTAAAAGAESGSSAANRSAAGSADKTAPPTDASAARAAPPANAATAIASVASTQAVAGTTPVAHIVAATQAALSSSVNLSPQAQQAVKVEAFTQLVANLVNHIQSGSATVPANWPTAGVSPQLQAFLSNVLQQATATQPLPQQLVSAQAWPTALTNAVLELAGQTANPTNGPAVITTAPVVAAAAAAAKKANIQLPALQNWLVQQGTVQAADGERSFTLTLRVPVAWAQAQAALGSALPSANMTSAANAATPASANAGPIGLAASPMPFATGFGSGSGAAGGMLLLPFSGSVQQLQNASMGLVMQPQVLPGSPAAAAAQAMRTSAILALEFQPLAQAAQSAQMASVFLPSHLLPQDVQAMLHNKVTDPWVLMMQNEADENGKKQPRNANEHNQNFCNRAGCQYQGRAICAQPFCAEMNYLWSVDRAHRASKL